MSKRKNGWGIYGVKVEVNPKVCYYCKNEMDEFSRTVDHLIPESRGGIRANKNKLYCCGDCNKLKGDMTPEEFERALNSMIRLESKGHKRRASYLKKVLGSVKILTEQKRKVDGN